jgi:hypothetical protein
VQLEIGIMGLFRGRFGNFGSHKRPSNGKRRLGAFSSTTIALEPLEDRRMLALVGVSPDFPLITYDATGVINYDAVAQSFDLAATPLTFKESAVDPTRAITNTPVPSFEINILVDNAGNVIGGVPGPDLRVFGDIDIDGDTVVDVSGVLLTGEIMQFGWQNVGNTDFFDFRFQVTGGLLAGYFAGKDIAIFNSAENSTFTGSFGVDFTGGAKGTLGSEDPLIPAIAIEKTVEDDGCEADIDGTGVVALFQPGDTATYNYAVSNPGNTALNITSIVDVNDNGTPGNPGDDIIFNPTPVEAGGFNVGDTNTNGLLDTNEIWLYTADVNLVNLGPTSNVVTVEADPVNGNGTPILNLDSVNAFDDLTVFVAQAGVTIEKRVNGQDSNVEPPPFDHVLQGAAVDYTYFITNTGNVILDLNNPILFEDDGGFGPSFTPDPVLVGAFNIGDANQNGLFDPGESWEFEYMNVVLDTLGLNTNTVNLELGALDFNGEPIDVDCVTPATATDIANIIVDLPGIDIVKTVIVPGCEADVNGMGVVPLFELNDIATYQYAVTNTGTTVLNITTLEDINDNGTPGDPGDDVVINPTPIEAGGFNVGDTNTNGLFDPGEIWQYEADFLLDSLGMFTNEVFVQAAPADDTGVPLPGFASVSATDDFQLFVATTAISIEKRVNGQDANVEPPPFQHVLEGGTVSYTYLVTNNGNLPLELASLIDDGGPQPSFVPSPVLKPNLKNIGDANNNDLVDPGESWEFEKINYVIDLGTPPGPFVNTATVVANPVDIEGERIICFDPVQASDIATIIVDQLVGSLSGYVYEDCDNDGIRTNGEAGIAGVTVNLYENNVLIDTQVTDAFGYYEFADLPAGTYEIREVQPAGYLDGIDTAGSLGGNAAVEVLQQVIDTISVIDVGPGEHGVEYNFGELSPSSIQGFVYIDVNNNGVKDPGEDPIPGVEIRLTGTDDRGNTVDVVVFTDANGEFFFAPQQSVESPNANPPTTLFVDGLRPSDGTGYTLTQTHPILFVDGKDKAGTAGGVVDSPNDIISGIMLEGCDDATGYLFGEFGLKVPSKRPYIFSDGQWHNETNPLDVNGDGKITSRDALIVIDTLNRLGLGALPEHNSGIEFPDTNQDGILSPSDLLQIINQLNVQSQYAPGVLNGTSNGNVASSVELSSSTGANIAQGLASHVESSSDSVVSNVSSGSVTVTTSAADQATASDVSHATLGDDDYWAIALGLSEDSSQEEATDAAFELLGSSL